MKLREMFEKDNLNVGMCFGRWNPPHKGHIEAWKIASNNDHWYVGTNKNTYNEKNPLPFEIKIAVMKLLYPNIDGHITPSKDAFELASMIYKNHGENVNLKVITDENWLATGLPKYNGVEGPHGYYKFKSIEHIASPRIGSATQVRQSILNNDKELFKELTGLDADTKITLGQTTVSLFALFNKFLQVNTVKSVSEGDVIQFKPSKIVTNYINLLRPEFNEYATIDSAPAYAKELCIKYGIPEKFHRGIINDLLDQYSELTFGPIIESSSLNSTIKWVSSDLITTLSALYKRMEISAQKYYSEHGVLDRGWSNVEQLFGYRWVQEYYIEPILGHLYDLAKYSPKHKTERLWEFLDRRDRKFESIVSWLPHALEPLLPNTSRKLDQIMDDYNKAISLLKPQVSSTKGLDKDDEGDDYLPKAQRTADYGKLLKKQDAHAAHIIKTVLSKLPPDIAKEIMNNINKSEHTPLVALKAELNQRNLLKESSEKLSKLIESTSLKSTLRLLSSDLLTTISELCTKLKIAAEKYYEKNGTMDNFEIIEAAMFNRWIQTVYVDTPIIDHLYDAEKYLPKHKTESLRGFLAERSRRWKTVIELLPYAISPFLPNTAQKFKDYLYDYWTFLSELKDKEKAALGQQDQSPKPKKQDIRKKMLGVQAVQAEKLVNQVLKTLPSNVAGDIRNAIAKSDNKLQALQIELKKRNLNESIKEITESVSLETTKRLLTSDITTTLNSLFTRMLISMRKYCEENGLDQNGNIHKEFFGVINLFGYKWLQDYYFDYILPHLYDLANRGPANETKRLNSFLNKRYRKFNDIMNYLPYALEPIMPETSRRLDNILDNYNKEYHKIRHEMQIKYGIIPPSASDNDDEDGYDTEPKAQRTADYDKVLKKQDAHAAHIIKTVLSKLPPDISNDILDRINKSNDPPLLALKIELERRHLAEGRDRSKLSKQMQDALPKLSIYDKLDNNNMPYLAYRFGIALAGCPDQDMNKKDAIGSSFTTIDYSDADAKIRKAAEKVIGVKPSKSTNGKSKEDSSTDTKSPVANIKRNKHGV